MAKVLVTGAFGQIGTELTEALRAKHGADNVLATGRHVIAEPSSTTGPCALLDVTDAAAVDEVVQSWDAEIVYHLAAMLSVVAEQDPQRAWQVNMRGLENLLETARRRAVRVFWPSSIAVFGPETVRESVPQEAVMRPTTIYGVSKVAGELLGDYYVRKHGVDVRGVRYPGVISSGSAPGGGTTDYAVEMFHAALDTGRYTAFVREDCVLPMIYMPDCVSAALVLMDADAARLQHHNGFNLAAMSFSAGDLAAEIRKHVPGFVCAFEPDERQQIADTWPASLDDGAARAEWGWAPRYDLAGMTTDMLKALRRGRRSAG